MGTINIVNVLCILLTHFIADFLCQTRTMATQKSKSLYWLSVHVLTYTVVTLIGWVTFLTINDGYPDKGFMDVLLRIFVTVWDIGVPLVIITFITHWVTDFCTSKLTTYLWSKKEEWKFFAVIGFDQLIHATTLLGTYGYLFN
jgi:hypothetical protein